MKVDSPEFADLLTDALRDGPGSPAWHEAVTLLRDAGAEGDDYRLLVRAREHLESGRAYRAVRAGPGFTRRLMHNLHGAPPRGPATANLVALVAAGVVLAVVAVVLWWVFPRAGGTRASAQDLGAIVFVNTVAEARFEAQWPIGWERLGMLPLAVDRGLHVPAAVPGDGFVGGALVSAERWAPDVPLAVDVAYVQQRPSDDLVLEVFVSDGASFSPDRAMSDHELIWLSRGRQVQVVLPGGRVQAQTDAQRAPSPQRVRLLLNRDAAVVKYNDRVLWRGEHGLSPDRPRRIGVRFLSNGQGSEKSIRVQSIRVMRPAR